MKKILILYIFAIMSYKAQQVTTILPINTVDYPNGAYLKDLTIDDAYAIMLSNEAHLALKMLTPTVEFQE